MAGVYAGGLFGWAEPRGVLCRTPSRGIQSHCLFLFALGLDRWVWNVTWSFGALGVGLTMRSRWDSIGRGPRVQIGPIFAFGRVSVELKCCICSCKFGVIKRVVRPDMLFFFYFLLLVVSGVPFVFLFYLVHSNHALIFLFSRYNRFYNSQHAFHQCLAGRRLCSGCGCCTARST